MNPGDNLSETISERAVAELLARSRRLGADLSVTNFGGGNTSVKTQWVDPIDGSSKTLLWIKGSGGDLGSLELSGLANLDLGKMRNLEKLYRGLAHEDEMVAYLDHCLIPGCPVAPSIDTPLHGLLPFAHVDHVHPDAVIAIATAANSEALSREIFGELVGWLPWQRPGFDLGLKLRDLVANNPDLEGCVLAGHGLIAWAEDSKNCYERTTRLIAKAQARLDECTQTPFGGARVLALETQQRLQTATQLMARLRAEVVTTQHKVGHFSDVPRALEFACSHDCERLAELGTSCPDHFLTTKLWPLVVEIDADIESAVAAYRKRYGDYYERFAGPADPPMRDANPVVFVVPRVGLCAFAATKQQARIACEFYVNAINVMRGAELLDAYDPLAEQEAFNIEYWALEEAKLRRRPAAKPLVGRVAVITGGGGGIGRAIAERFLREDACVLLLDIDPQGLERASSELARDYPNERIKTHRVDVRCEQSVAVAFEVAQLEFGGVDVLVANAGIASSASVTDLTAADWDRNFAVLGRGYFLAAQAAFKLMQASRGGSIIFVGSKNALAASPGAAAYCSAKAAELHLARCLALEGAPHQIRVNSVNPDAVLSGSKIWSSEWREARAAAYGIDTAELEDFYVGRSLLKRPVLPADVAEAVYFFASDASAKSTGNIINVDAGNANAFPR